MENTQSHYTVRPLHPIPSFHKNKVSRIIPTTKYASIVRIARMSGGRKDTHEDDLPSIPFSVSTQKGKKKKNHSPPKQSAIDELKCMIHQNIPPKGRMRVWKWLHLLSHRKPLKLSTISDTISKKENTEGGKFEPFYILRSLRLYETRVYPVVNRSLQPSQYENSRNEEC